MNDVKPIVAKNITSLRQSAGMTQMELASSLNYSDKAVSKWERGESVPDVSVLCEIARLFCVTVDYLITDHDGEDADEELSEKSRFASESALPEDSEGSRKKSAVKNRAFITAMSVILVWLVAATVFVILDIVLSPDVTAHRLAFVYAVPASVIVWLVLNTVWFDRRRNFLIISILMWSVIGSVVLTMLTFGFNVWKILILGAPGQIIILLWSRIDLRSK